MLTDLEHFSPAKPYAVCPTQYAERYEGYDVRIEAVKLVMFQFKQAKDKSYYYAYKIPDEQLRTLKSRAGRPGLAYYVLPTLITAVDLQTAIYSGSYFNQIFYVDVVDIPFGTNQIYISKSSAQTALEPKLARDWTLPVRCSASKHIINAIRWPELFERIKSCTSGIRFFERDYDGFKLTKEGDFFLQKGKWLEETTRSWREADSAEKRELVAKEYVQFISSKWPEARALELEVETLKHQLLEIASSKNPRMLDFAFGGIRRSQWFSVPMGKRKESLV